MTTLEDGPGRVRRERQDMEEAAGTRLTERWGEEADRHLVAEGNSLPAHDLLERVSTELVYSRAGQPAGAQVLNSDIADALALLDQARRDLDAVECQLLRTSRKREMTWKTIAQQLDLDSPQAAQQRARRLELVVLQRSRTALGLPSPPQKSSRSSWTEE